MAINFAKLDPILTGDVQAPNAAGAKIEVIIEPEGALNADQQAFLARLGVKGHDLPKVAFPTKLSVNDIEALSNEPWVKRLWGSIDFGTCFGQ